MESDPNIDYFEVEIEGDPGVGSSQETEAQEARGRVFLQEGISHPGKGVWRSRSCHTPGLLRESRTVSHRHGVFGRYDRYLDVGSRNCSINE